jgi:hypothetical protein
MLLDCADIAAHECRMRRAETRLGLFNGQDRRPVAIVITADGRRVPVPMDDLGLVDVSLLALLRSLGLGLLGLITGSRRENGGSRRDRRA